VRCESGPGPGKRGRLGKPRGRVKQKIGTMKKRSRFADGLVDETKLRWWSSG
jgi:hypothetical protein